MEERFNNITHSPEVDGGRLVATWQVMACSEGTLNTPVLRYRPLVPSIIFTQSLGAAEDKHRGTEWKSP